MYGALWHYYVHEWAQRERLLNPCFGLFSAPGSLSLRHIFWFARMVRWAPSTFQIHGSGHQYEGTQWQVRKPRGRAPQRPIRVGWRHARLAPGVTLTVKNFYQSHLINLISAHLVVWPHLGMFLADPFESGDVRKDARTDKHMNTPLLVLKPLPLDRP